MARYSRLSAQDASFLASESETTPMVLGALAIYDGKHVTLSDGSLHFERIRSHIAGALHRSSSLTRTISQIPLFGHPVWTDAPEVDLEHHLNRAALPAPGHIQSLMDLVGRIYTMPLPRDRPLWDIWIIEGLADQRFATLTRMHHALIDGGAGLEVLSAFHSLAPEPEGLEEPQDPEPWKGDAGPEPLELVIDEVTHRIFGAGKLLGSLVQNLAEPRRALNRGMRIVEGLLSLAGQGAAPSPLNGRLAATRRVAWLTTPLDELRSLRRSLGGTLNDAALAVMAGALRGLLTDAGRNVDDLALRVSCPSNSRAAGATDATGNHTASFIIDLPIHLANPLDRYDAVVEATERAKVSKQADAVQFVLDLADQTAPELASALMSVASRFQNLVVSNVAGPPVPVYLGQCMAQEFHVLTILMPNIALAITLFSYHGRMSWSLCADWHLVPSLLPLEHAIRKEIALLSSLEPRW